MSHHSLDKSLTDLIEECDNKLSLKEASEDGLFKREGASLITQAKAEHLKSALGPTGDFPAGKIAPQDEGGLMIGITSFNGRLILDFGKPVHSIGFTKKEALEFAKALKARAATLPKIIGEESLLKNGGVELR